MSFDSKCYELAKYFLADEPVDTEENRKLFTMLLAQDIQDTIETAIEGMREKSDHAHTCQQCGKLLKAHCACGKPNINMWCSSNCRAAFDL